MSFQCIRCHSEIDKDFKACPHCGEPVTEFLRRYLQEPVDGKYRILERLGAGGMGEVYKVEHVYLRAIRVIKVIRPQISESEEAHERFLREAQLATKVQHPNVATLHDFSALPDGSHYMVWEFIEGKNLAERIHERGVLQPGDALSLATQALAGLEAIHRAGIIHRDISPENLMITGEGQVKIIDLGVAKSEEGDYAVTRTGIFVGKLRYASPEHLGFLPEGEKIDGRADLYSMGVVLFEMLTGKPPFQATSPHQYILHHSQDTAVQPLDLSTVPGGQELRDVLRRALEHDRTKRFASARDFATALENVAGKVKTLADDETMRVPPPAAAPTVRTEIPKPPPAPAPAPPPAAPTVIDASLQKRSSAGPILAVVAILGVAFVAIAAAGFFAWRLWVHHSQAAVVTSTIAKTDTASPPHTQAATIPAPEQPKPATATVDVAPQPAPTETQAQAQPEPEPQVRPAEQTTTTPPVAPKKKVAAKQIEPEPPAETEERTVPTGEATQIFTEGGMDSRNEEAIRFARERLRGVNRVSTDFRGDDDLVKQLGGVLQGMNLSVDDRADVKIRFYGKVTHLRFGKKQRAAEATILRKGQAIFRYEMKPEDYRVGDNPAEAFARVLSDLFQR